MDNQEIVDHILGFCESAFVEVFQNQGCLVYRIEKEADISGFDHITIDATADELKLAMCLSIPSNILYESYPMRKELESADDPRLLDWYQELANRLMGSLKNRLVSGISPMKLGLPEAAFELSSEFDWQPVLFQMGDQVFGCELAVSVIGEIESLDQEEVDCIDGELEFF